MRRIIIVFLALLVLAGVAFWKFAPNFKPSEIPGVAEPIELTIWGFWEDEGLFRKLSADYQKIHPDIRLNYVASGATNYRPRVQTQILNKQGPDIFLLHNSWVPMLQKTAALSGAPEEVFGVDAYSKTFYPIVKDFFVVSNKIYAVPLGVDGLSLFVNEDILKAANVSVPQTWDQFISAAVKMTVKDGSGNIQTAGAALGTPKNVDHWSDILGLLFLEQPGADLSKPTTNEAAEVLRFFTNFANDSRQKVWDSKMESSTQAFYSGRLALYFAPSWRAQEIAKANPSLKFKTAPVPQLTDKAVSWGSFWGLGVSGSSTHPKEAWEFLKYLSSKDTAKFLYQESSATRLFKAPLARVDLANEVSGDPILGSFISQAPYYKGWFLSSGTQDQGVNDEMITLYQEAVDKVLQGQSPSDALQSISPEISAILDKYARR